MTENHRSPGEHVINVGISIQVVEFRALGPLNKTGVATHGSERADRAVDPSWDELLRFLEELDRSGDFHNGWAPYHAEIEGSRKRLGIRICRELPHVGSKSV